MDKVWSHLVHTEFGICFKYFSDNGDWITDWNHSIMMELIFWNSNWIFANARLDTVSMSYCNSYGIPERIGDF